MFEALHREGIDVYVLGGLVRDALCNIAGNDVDISYTSTAQQLATFADLLGWRPLVTSRGYVKIPSELIITSDDLCLVIMTVSVRRVCV